MWIEVRSSPLPKPPEGRWPRCDMMPSIFELWWMRSAAQHHCLWACLLGRHTSLLWLTSPYSPAQSYHSTLISAARLEQGRSHNTITATRINLFLALPATAYKARMAFPLHAQRLHRSPGTSRPQKWRIAGWARRSLDCHLK